MSRPSSSSPDREDRPAPASSGQTSPGETPSLWTRIILAPIRFYQRYLSRLKPFPTCRFTPCCSTYAATALRRFGLLRGGLMAFCRILRCNPLCKGGADPVPHHFTLRPFAGLEDLEEP